MIATDEHGPGTQPLPEPDMGHDLKTATFSTPAVILAGGTAKPELQAVIGESVRALAMVQGKTLLSYVVNAMAAASCLGEITVVGDVPDSDAYVQIMDGGDFVTNLFAGLTRYRDAGYVVVGTCDLPYLKAASVDSFTSSAITLAEHSGAQIIYPIVPVEECYRQFPGIKRTARKMREGNFTGGNMMLMRPGFMMENRKRIADAYAARKSPARLAAMLGIGTLIRLVLSQTISPNLLPISLLEERASALLGGKVKAHICNHADIATDLDKPEDFIIAAKGGL